MKNIVPALSVQDLRAGYDSGADVLKGISLEVGQGEVVSVVGANGSGKSTLLNTIAGFLRPRVGTITLGGSDIGNSRPDAVAERGVGYLMEGHSVFSKMSIEDNLLMGAWRIRRDRHKVVAALETAYGNVPWLRDRRKVNAGLLSGGQQRILELERLYMTKPSMVLLDEPSLGLAPKLAELVYRRALQFKEDGSSVIIVDQNIKRVLEISDRCYVLRLGLICAEGSGVEMSRRAIELAREMI